MASDLTPEREQELRNLIARAMFSCDDPSSYSQGTSVQLHACKEQLNRELQSDMWWQGFFAVVILVGLACMLASRIIGLRNKRKRNG